VNEENANQVSIEPHPVWEAPIDPIAVAAGISYLPLSGGASIWRVDPELEQGRFAQALRDLGHTVVVGDAAVLARAVVERLGL
jgi:hypothetical protein